MQDIQATSILALMDTTKAERKSFALQILSAIEEGKVSPLMIHCQLKATENLIKQFTDAKEGKEIAEQYKSFLLDEAAKYGKKFDFHSGGFEVKEAGVKYDYSQCNDAEMDKLLAQQETLTQAIKDRETLLKGIKGHLDVIDEETGEVVTLYPPVKTSTTTVAVTLK